MATKVNRVRVEVSLPPEMKAWISRNSHRMGVSQSQLVEYCLRMQRPVLTDEITIIENDMRGLDLGYTVNDLVMTAAEEVGRRVLEMVDPA